MATRDTDTRAETAADGWLSLQEACELLGVAPSTLRRWADSGRVPTRRTLGGHRRFARAALAHLAQPTAADAAVAQLVPCPAASHPAWGIDAQELARQDWHIQLAARPAAQRMRGLGQRLLGLLIQYINRREDDDRFLIEARAVGNSYGTEARGAETSLHDTVEAFLFFRRAFTQSALPLPGIAQPTDLAAAAALHARIDRFMDAILLGVIAGFEGQELLPSARGAG